MGGFGADASGGGRDGMWSSGRSPGAGSPSRRAGVLGFLPRSGTGMQCGGTQTRRQQERRWVSVTFGELLETAWVSVTFGELLLHWAGSERRPRRAAPPSGVSRAAPAAVASAFLRIACPSLGIACPSNSWAKSKLAKEETPSPPTPPASTPLRGYVRYSKFYSG